MPEVTDVVVDAAPPLVLADSLGGIVDQLYILNEEKRALDAQLADLDRKRRFVEAAIMDRMEEQKTTKIGGALASASISSSIVPDVIDWEAFYKYIARTKYFHLLERRPSSTGCRELFETKGKIPGVVPYNKIKLSIRKA